MKTIYESLIGGFSPTPSSKIYARPSNWIMNPQSSGWKVYQRFENRHLGPRSFIEFRKKRNNKNWDRDQDQCSKSTKRMDGVICLPFFLLYYSMAEVWILQTKQLIANSSWLLWVQWIQVCQEKGSPYFSHCLSGVEPVGGLFSQDISRNGSLLLENMPRI